MTTTPSTAEPGKRPEGEGAGVPEGIARLLMLLRWLISYGKMVAENVPQFSAEQFHVFADRYRRSDFNEILARIKRGIMLAAALEEKLRKRAATGRDVAPVNVRWETGRRKGSAPEPKRKRVRHTNIVDMPPDPLPSAAQIAAELRRRPLGAVLVDICRDLGLSVNDLTDEQWNELHGLILRYGGNPTDVLYAEWRLRLRPVIEAAPRRKRNSAAADTAAPRNQAASPTGPPPLPQAA